MLYKCNFYYFIFLIIVTLYILLLDKFGFKAAALVADRPSGSRSERAVVDDIQRRIQEADRASCNGHRDVAVVGERRGACADSLECAGVAPNGRSGADDDVAVEGELVAAAGIGEDERDIVQRLRSLQVQVAAVDEGRRAAASQSGAAAEGGAAAREREARVQRHAVEVDVRAGRQIERVRMHQRSAHHSPAESVVACAAQ